jgi:hypothetical protein
MSYPSRKQAAASENHVDGYGEYQNSRCREILNLCGKP